MFKRDFDDTYFNTYEEAADAAFEDFDMSDFIEYGELTDYDKISDMIKELARLESPLYDTLLGDAFNAYCHECINEIEEEEED
jgi:hypothetical protein